MSAKLCVAAGASFQLNCGETLGPSHVNFFGIVWPLENTVLEMWKDMASLSRDPKLKSAEKPYSPEGPEEALTITSFPPAVEIYEDEHNITLKMEVHRNEDLLRH